MSKKSGIILDILDIMKHLGIPFSDRQFFLENMRHYDEKKKETAKNEEFCQVEGNKLKKI